MAGSDKGLPFEEFIQAITTQLDRAQRAMAIKAKNGNLPLTFAVKDLSLDLRTHVEMRGSAVYIRPAASNEGDASTIHLNLTTITRPMIEENAVAFEEDEDEPSLDEVLSDQRPAEREELRRRLEWAGINRVSQLRNLQGNRQERQVQRITQLPLARLRTALERAEQPRIASVAVEPQPAQPSAGGTAPVKSPPVLRIKGSNLLRGGTPVVRLRGTPLPILRATPQELVVQAQGEDLSGALALEIEPGVMLEAELTEEVPTDVGGKQSLEEEL